MLFRSGFKQSTQHTKHVISRVLYTLFSLKNSFLLVLFLDAAAVAADMGHETDTRNDHKCVNRAAAQSDIRLLFSSQIV